MGEKKLISPEFRVTVGEYEIKDGVEVECFSSRESHIDWCRVELSPRLQGLIQFKDMDEAQVELGYEDDFDTLIDGYVRCNGSDYWKEIMIKDDMMKLEKSADDWKMRKALQERAARNCNNLLALIQLAKTIFHLKSKRVKYWSEKTIDVRGYLRSWRDADSKRYGK